MSASNPRLSNIGSDRAATASMLSSTPAQHHQQNLQHRHHLHGSSSSKATFSSCEATSRTLETTADALLLQKAAQNSKNERIEANVAETERELRAGFRQLHQHSRDLLDKHAAVEDQLANQTRLTADAQCARAKLLAQCSMAHEMAAAAEKQRDAVSDTVASKVLPCRVDTVKLFRAGKERVDAVHAKQQLAAALVAMQRLAAATAALSSTCSAARAALLPGASNGHILVSDDCALPPPLPQPAFCAIEAAKQQVQNLKQQKEAASAHERALAAATLSNDAAAVELEAALEGALHDTLRGLTSALQAVAADDLPRLGTQHAEVTATRHAAELAALCSHESLRRVEDIECCWHADLAEMSRSFAEELAALAAAFCAQVAAKVNRGEETLQERMLQRAEHEQRLAAAEANQPLFQLRAAAARLAHAAELPALLRPRAQALHELHAEATAGRAELAQLRQNRDAENSARLLAAIGALELAEAEQRHGAIAGAWLDGHAAVWSECNMIGHRLGVEFFDEVVARSTQDMQEHVARSNLAIMEFQEKERAVKRAQARVLADLEDRKRQALEQRKANNTNNNNNNNNNNTQTRRMSATEFVAAVNAAANDGANQKQQPKQKLNDDDDDSDEDVPLVVLAKNRNSGGHKAMPAPAPAVAAAAASATVRKAASPVTRTSAGQRRARGAHQGDEDEEQEPQVDPEAEIQTPARKSNKDHNNMSSESHNNTSAKKASAKKSATATSTAAAAAASLAGPIERLSGKLRERDCQIALAPPHQQQIQPKRRRSKSSQQNNSNTSELFFDFEEPDPVADTKMKKEPLQLHLPPAAGTSQLQQRNNNNNNTSSTFSGLPRILVIGAAKNANNNSSSNNSGIPSPSPAPRTPPQTTSKRATTGPAQQTRKILPIADSQLHDQSNTNNNNNKNTNQQKNAADTQQQHASFSLLAASLTGSAKKQPPVVAAASSSSTQQQHAVSAVRGSALGELTNNSKSTANNNAKPRGKKGETQSAKNNNNGNKNNTNSNVPRSPFDITSLDDVWSF